MTAALRVAIVGSGPAGLYAAAEVLKRDPCAEVDLFERLPAPGGLVRSGVSPDHAARRAITTTYERLLFASGRFRLRANVEIGSTLSREELAAHFHAVIHASGASSDRRLGIAGESLAGSVAATDFVGWYNGHPDFAQDRFDLSSERAIVVGNGNVALDVARMLLLSPERLQRTDIADHALAALAQSGVREVVILGRRGPAQAAFTAPELLELGELEDVDVIVEANPADLADEARCPNPLRLRLLREYAQRGALGRPKRLVLRFLSSPVEIVGDTRVRGMRVQTNTLVEGAKGVMQARPTGEETLIEAGLVFRAVGYRARALPGLPFDDAAGRIPNAQGRVIDPASGAPIRGQYVAGWLKRGPSGVIGSNKPCSQQTVAALLADAAHNALTLPTCAPGQLDALLASRNVDVVDYHAWKQIDRAERRAGREQGRPRVKLCSVPELLNVAR